MYNYYKEFFARFFIKKVGWYMIQFGPIIILVVNIALLGGLIYGLTLLIKALKIYIKKNS